jgi:S1-C subfamily serine protease
LLVGDILVAIGDTPVADVDTLRAQLGGDKLDQTLSMKILRGGEAQQVNVTIGERA